MSGVGKKMITPVAHAELSAELAVCHEHSTMKYICSVFEPYGANKNGGVFLASHREFF